MKNKTLTISTTKQETIFGWIYLAFQMIALPGLLTWANNSMGLSEAELNFCFFVINFIAILLIFHKYLSRSFTQLLQTGLNLLTAAENIFIVKHSLLLKMVCLIL